MESHMIDGMHGVIMSGPLDEQPFSTLSFNNGYRL